MCIYIYNLPIYLFSHVSIYPYPSGSVPGPHFQRIGVEPWSTWVDDSHSTFQSAIKGVKLFLLTVGALLLTVEFLCSPIVHLDAQTHTHTFPQEAKKLEQEVKSSNEK